VAGGPTAPPLSERGVGGRAEGKTRAGSRRVIWQDAVLSVAPAFVVRSTEYRVQRARCRPLAPPLPAGEGEETVLVGAARGWSECGVAGGPMARPLTGERTATGTA
jgi:hypothetical protein